MTKTRVVEIPDAHNFLERTRAFLFSDEVGHNLLLSSALSLLKIRRSPGFLIAETDNQVTGCALRSPNDRWVVSTSSTEAAQAIHEHIPPTARSITTDAPIKGPRQNLMALRKLQPIDPAPGLLRFAQAKDLKKLTAWSRLFAEESGLDETAREAEEVIQKFFESKQLFVWDDGTIKAMAAIGGFTPKSARISMVYTDVKARGRQYATTLVHRIAHRLQQENRTAVLLCDATNEQTNYIYEKIGFRRLKTLTESKSPDNDLTPATSSR